jgi:hypothetical protein
MKLLPVFIGLVLLATVGCSSSLESSTYAEEGQPGNVFTSGGGGKRTFGGCMIGLSGEKKQCHEFDTNGGLSLGETSGGVGEQEVPESCLFEIFGGEPLSLTQEPRADGSLRLRAAFEGTSGTRARVFASLEAATEICPAIALYFE